MMWSMNKCDLSEMILKGAALSRINSFISTLLSRNLQIYFASSVLFILFR